MTSTRTPLVHPDMPEGTPSARRYGAQILGRAIAHMTVTWDTTIDASWWPGNLARDAGFTDAEAQLAGDAYVELLGG